MVRSLMFRISAALAVAFTAGAVLVATGSAATANDGDPVILGATNSTHSTTIIYSDGNGLEAYAVTGVFGGGNAGSGTYGVRGSSNGTGVYGFTWSISGGNGVWGQTSGPGSGVYGENDASG